MMADWWKAYNIPHQVSSEALRSVPTSAQIYKHGNIVQDIDTFQSVLINIVGNRVINITDSTWQFYWIYWINLVELRA